VLDSGAGTREMRQKRLGLVASGSLGLALALGLGCGRSSLINTGEDALAGSTSLAGSAGSRSVSAGGKGSAGSGFGGTFGQAGTPSGGFINGGFPSAGFPSAGFPSGGFPNEGCQLPVGDCRRDGDRECLDSRQPCEGALGAPRDFGTTRAFVRDIAISSSGQIAIAGDFVGVLDFGGLSEPLVSVGVDATNTDAFVASFDSLGNAVWAYSFSSESSTASGVRFTPAGDVVAQGKRGPMTFLIWLNAQGEITSSQLTRCVSCEPGHVAVDNDGNVVLGGSYTGELFHAGATLNHTGSAGYVIKLNKNGDLLWAQNVVPDSWTSAVTTGVVVDDEDSVVVVGNGEHDSSTGAFFRKLSANGQERFTRQLQASGQITFRAVAVDRRMQIVVAGELEGQMSSAGKLYQSSSSAVPDLWWARYDGDGQLAVQQLYATAGKGVSVDAATVDPFGNVLLAGSVGGLAVDGLLPLTTDALFVLKLRTDGNGVWLRSLPGTAQKAALAADNQGNAWVGASFDGQQQLGDTAIDAAGNLHGILFKLSP